MKRRFLFGLIAFVLIASLLVGCGGNGADETEDNKLIIGVSPEPHSKIMEFAKEKLAEEDIDLEIKEFTDYVIPNEALDSGDLDINFFQHLPYLEDYNKNTGTELVKVANVHIEPIALYTEKDFKLIDELPEGAVIGIPNDPSNGGRALLLLEANGLIKLKEDAGLEATELDIAENPHNFEFKPLEAATLPKVLDDLDAAVINGNYAMEAGFNPIGDGLIIEDEDSPYVNIIATRVDNKDSELIKKLVEIMNSDEMREFLIEEFDGAILPGF